MLYVIQCCHLFLQLLVAEMKYQDPLEPTTNTEYVSELASFTQVEATQNARTRGTGKTASRTKISWAIIAVTTLGSLIVAIDALGAGPLPKPFGLETWLDAFDLFAEGFMMPIGCLVMAVLLGWMYPDYIDDEVESGSGYVSKKYVKFCLKWLAPIFMVFILVGQMNSFFGLGLF